jgi:hypothetical protein
MDRNDRLDDELERDAMRVRSGGSTGDHADLDVAGHEELRRDPATTTGDEVGEAVGGISGVLTGAALGSLGGPLGTIIGGIAGAVSGWWAGKAISEASRHVTEEDDSFYRSHYDGATTRLADRSYDDVRPAYQLGHIAGRNPDYAGRGFEDVEGDLQRGWTSDVSARHGEWTSVRPYAREAFERGRGTAGTAGTSAAGGMATGAASSGMRDASAGGYGGVGTGAGAGRSTERLDDATDRIGMHGRDTSDRLDAAGGRAMDRSGDANENAWERTTRSARDLADRAGDALDDTKDRVDGNPASRPGVDRTDDVDRRL